MSATRKKVIVRQWNGELHRGYLPISAFAPAAQAELLLPDARVLSLSTTAIKHVAFVRDFNPADPSDPERIGARTFSSKPRSGGTWVRVHFLDGDTLEGLVQAGLPLLDTFLLDHGVFVEPPETRSNTLRLFVPRSAMRGLDFLGVAGSRPRTRRAPALPADIQRELFLDPRDEE